MSQTHNSVIKQLIALGNPQIAAHAQRFFKTAPGQYAAGDQFIGVRVPILRQLSKRYRDLDLAETEHLLSSPIHEARMLALLILVLCYQREPLMQTPIYELYLSHTQYINNWDLVDTSADKIVGAHLFERSRQPLRLLAKSTDLWQRRIAIIATFYFIRRHDFDDTLSLAKRLLDDDHDLIHKAVGWMLREVGNRDRATMEVFLQQHYRHMPRTMLRYAIEKLPETKRQAYLKGKIA